MAGADLVSGVRHETHGNAEHSFNRIAELWSAYLGITVTASDYAMLMALMKIGRTMYGSHNVDDYIDGAAYIALAEDVRDA